jgi:superfamily II DNA or RNA helicase
VGIDCSECLIFKGSLRPEQQKPVNNFLEAAADERRKGGIISLQCGGGKTICALNIICELKKKTLIICHKEFLLNQWRERIMEFIPTASVGLIKAKTIKTKGCDIVLASLQSLATKDYDSEIFEDFGLVVVDECLPYTQQIVSGIGSIKIGMLYKMWKNKEPLPKILSYNETTKQFEYNKITYAWEKTNPNLLKISYGNSNFKCTYNHKVLTLDGYKEASQLKVDDLLMCNIQNDLQNYGTVKITTIEKVDTNEYSYNNYVYDIEVENNHNFICSYESNIGPIVHNCHHMSAEVFVQALPKVTASVFLGLSATLNRKDGLRKVFEWFLGKVVNEIIPRIDKELIVKMVKFSGSPPDYGVEKHMWNGKRNCPGMITDICNCTERIEAIVNEYEILLSDEPDRKTLILSGRREHLKSIENELIDRGHMSIGYYVGGMREEDLKKSESADIILATFAMASEGMDIASLNTLILASPVSDIEQSVGRVQRQKPHERKYVPYIIDIWDQYSMFIQQGIQHMKFYKKNGYTILNDDTQKNEIIDDKQKNYDFIDD